MKQKNIEKIWMSWSSGKDSAFALYELRSDPRYLITGLLTTITETYQRVSMHGVREELVELQAKALGLPLHKVNIPPTCVNEIYESRMSEAISIAIQEGVSHMGFGDLFLEDIRAYREDKFAGSGVQPLFPLWKRNTTQLSQSMLRSGLRSVLTCVDPKVLPPSFAGREYDAGLLSVLPSHVDPCGENGEFHTFVYDGPMFKNPIPVRVGERVERDGFVFADLVPV